MKYILLLLLTSCTSVAPLQYHTVDEEMYIAPNISKYIFTDARGHQYKFFGDPSLYEAGDTIDFKEIVCYKID